MEAELGALRCRPSLTLPSLSLTQPLAKIIGIAHTGGKLC